jgi:hypothetical protein
MYSGSVLGKASEGFKGDKFIGISAPTGAENVQQVSFMRDNGQIISHNYTIIDATNPRNKQRGVVKKGQKIEPRIESPIFQILGTEVRNMNDVIQEAVADGDIMDPKETLKFTHFSVYQVRGVKYNVMIDHLGYFMMVKQDWVVRSRFNLNLSSQGEILGFKNHNVNLMVLSDN